MEEEDLDAIGFMFDKMREKVFTTFSFPNSISINISAIDDNPGHVQSGLYLWPAAECACHYLISIWGDMKPKTVVELGAGCGLSGKFINRDEHFNLKCN